MTGLLLSVSVSTFWTRFGSVSTVRIGNPQISLSVLFHLCTVKPQIALVDIRPYELFITLKICTKFTFKLWAVCKLKIHLKPRIGVCLQMLHFAWCLADSAAVYLGSHNINKGKSKRESIREELYYLFCLLVQGQIHFQSGGRDEIWRENQKIYAFVFFFFPVLFVLSLTIFLCIIEIHYYTDDSWLTGAECRVPPWVWQASFEPRTYFGRANNSFTPHPKFSITPIINTSFSKYCWHAR